MNEFEAIVVQEDLARKGIEHYSMRPGNDCVWVSYYQGYYQVDCYYIFRDGRLAEIQFD